MTQVSKRSRSDRESGKADSRSSDNVTKAKSFSLDSPFFFSISSLVLSFIVLTAFAFFHISHFYCFIYVYACVHVSGYFI